MNKNKYTIILVVALFAIAAISVFGADQDISVSTGDVSAQAAIDTQISGLGSGNISVKLDAVRKLSKTRNRRAKNALIRELRQQKNHEIRARIVESFANSMDTTTATEAVSIMQKDPDVPTRKAAAYSLGFARDRSGIKPLIDTFLDTGEDIGVRCVAAGSLARQQASEQLFDCFSTGMQDANPVIRLQALTSFALCFWSADTKRTIDTLTKMLNDSDPGVKKAARERIALLSPEKRKAK